MNCFRKKKDKRRLEDPDCNGKEQQRILKYKVDEKDGIHYSKTLVINEPLKSTSCCGNGGRRASREEKTELTQFTQNGNGIVRYEAYLPVSKNNPFYNMDHPKRGKAVIFNFDHWDNTAIPDLGLSPRLGSQKDKNDLAKCLAGLDFEISPHDNCGNLDFWRILEEVRREDHTDKDCLLVAIMTHGERNTVYMVDGTQIPVNLIWEFFEAHLCPSLAGKPKIFLIQACRGKKYDSGTTLLASPALAADENKIDFVDAGTFSYVIPNAADILVAFSCPIGHYSWRNPEKGSWFVQAICKVFEEHGYQMDLQALLTRVAREVALNYQSNTYDVDSHKKKQVTSTSSTLIRTVCFAPKPKLPLHSSGDSGENLEAETDMEISESGMISNESETQLRL